MEDIAIYHVMKADEGFDETAQMLFQLVQKSQEQMPGARRAVFLDIEGHRNEEGGFDPDAYEIQKEYLLGFLGKYVSKIVTPLYETGFKDEQDNDIPGGVRIEKE